MVQFNKDTYTVEFDGDAVDYFATLRAISRLIAVSNRDEVPEDDHYRAARLLEQMMPDEGQEIVISN